MARWINVTKPFDYRWPDRSAITAFNERSLGDHFVKDEIADFAVGHGYASEGKAAASSRSRKGKAARKEKAAAETADTGRAEIVGDADAADADRTPDRPPVDHDAGERE